MAGASQRADGQAGLGAHEEMECDVVIVGAGPAGLCAAVRLLQMAKEKGKETSVFVIEKGSEVGAHILSGAVIDPKALDELMPDWRERDHPLATPAGKERFCFLTQERAFNLPVPPTMRNKGCLVASLGKVCRWLATEAESLGATILPGFAAVDLLWQDGKVAGVVTGDMGLGKDGKPTPRHQRGVAIRAKQTIIAEGCRGSLAKGLVARLDLAKGKDPQVYGIGIKELWQVPRDKARPGTIIHTVGWPLASDVYGGSFLYHLDDDKVAVGLVVGLDYRNPYLSPFMEFQRLKQHPIIREHLDQGERIGYGARALNEGGIQSIPRLTFPGGCLVGCCAGFMNTARLKGSHTAMKTGMLAAEAVFGVLDDKEKTEPVSYEAAVKDSWVWPELRRARNIRPGFRHGLKTGLALAAIDTYLFRNKAPWTLRQRPDHEGLLPASKAQKIDYPRPDGKLSFDRESSVHLAGIRHDDNQPCHLLLKDASLALEVNHARHDSPESRYCPAGVYEMVEGDKGWSLRINSQNCVHCKTCDIKDPMQNITWVPPEGGSGPNYQEL